MCVHVHVRVCVRVCARARVHLGPKDTGLMALVGKGDGSVGQDGGGYEDDEDDEDYMPRPPSPTLDWRRVSELP